MKGKLYNAITDIPGLRLGHATDLDALTGCTVILCEAGAVGGVDQRGGAPGTRQTDALYPMHLVEQVHAVLLAGGSAFGLDAAGGVARYLEERGVGFDVRVARVPIVPAAILFDLAVGRPDVRPTPDMGYQACLNASTGLVEEGNVGAGTGATVGKILGLQQAMKAGLGTCSLELTRGLRIAALAAVNAFGDVIDPSSGQIIAGARSFLRDGVRIGRGEIFADTLHMMKELASNVPLNFARRQNTVIGVVATNARLNKEQVNKMAQMAHDGLARAVRPAHTMLDGDTIFALSLGNKTADINLIGACAAELFTEAILRAVRAAQSLPGLPALQDLKTW
jgi:L-aminopeptidase/D-esterase-like protein